MYTSPPPGSRRKLVYLPRRRTASDTGARFVIWKTRWPALRPSGVPWRRSLWCSRKSNTACGHWVMNRFVPLVFLGGMFLTEHCLQPMSLVLSSALLRAILTNYHAHDQATKTMKSIENNLKAQVSDLENAAGNLQAELRKVVGFPPQSLNVYSTIK